MDIKQSQFESLVSAYCNDLYQYAFWLCRNHALAEDIVQETYMRAWKAMDQIRETSKMKAWLFTIARRESARYFGSKHHKTLSLEEIELEALNGYTIEHCVIDHLHLRQALSKLDLKYSEPLVLQIIGGYSSEEIASILDMQAGAVTTRLFRARQRLKKMLEPNPSESNLLVGKKP